MKIVQVTPRYPPRTGGVERHVRELSERLANRGHDVIVLTADADDDLAGCERRNGVAIHRHRGFSPQGAYHFAPELLTTIRSVTTDAVVTHIHNYHSLLLPLAAAGSRCPFVVTAHYHGASDHPLRDGLLSLYAPVGRRILNRAAERIAVSKWERAQMREDFDIDATVIPNGIDVDWFAAGEPIDRDRPFLLSVGRLEEYKGVQHCVRALVDLPEYELVVVGTGPYRKDIHSAAARAGVSDRVSLLGYVSDDRLRRLYAGAAVTVLLSSFEAYGMTIGESLAAGTPCVVLSERALADWNRYDGVVAISNVDPETVSDAVERAAASSTPAIDVLPRWDEVVDRVLDTYPVENTMTE